MSVFGTGPKCNRGQRSGAVSVCPGGMRAGSTPSGTRLFLKRKAIVASIGTSRRGPAVPRSMAYWPFPKLRGPVAQLGERVNRTHEARGSNPLGSTYLFAMVTLRIVGGQTGDISAEIPPGLRQIVSTILINDPAAHGV